ncbi:MAG TPA: acyltransferase domain-containing protein, partial [Longimicrobium sp.]
GRELLANEPVFREAVEACDEWFRPLAGWSLLEAMLADEASSRMEETEVAQPANFALQVGLTALWRSWGIVPEAIVGHSAGEAAAAYAAGVMSLETAVRVIYHRSRLQQLTTGQGRLVAVGLPVAEVEALLAGHRDRVSVAAVNGPSAVTLVGDPEALEEVLAPVREQGAFVRYLHVKVPYHSHYMDPLRPELLETLADLDLHAAAVPLYSTVSGERADGREFDAEYWWRNVREPVRFADAADALIEHGHSCFLEVGPHPVLATSLQECLGRRGRAGTVLPSLRRGEEEGRMLLGSLGALYTLGHPVAWERLYAEGGRFTRLPAYPWQRERCWNESPASVRDRLETGAHPLLGQRQPSPHPTWEIELDKDRVAYLNDHEIQGTVVYPGAAYVEMALAAAREIFGDRAGAMCGTDVRFRKALFLPDGELLRLRLVLNPEDASFSIYTRPLQAEDAWTLHATGGFRPDANRLPGQVGVDEIRARCALEVPRDVCYRQFRNLGLEYGTTFRGIGRLWQGEGEALAELQVP